MYSNLKVQLGTVHEAAEKGSLEKLQEIVAFYAKRNKSEAFVLHEREALLGCQPIHLAVERGHVGFVKYLVDKKVDLNAGDYDLVTPVHIAAVGNQVEILKMLVANAAIVKGADERGDTPLHWAASRGNVEVMNILLSKDAATEATNKQGFTPLHFAAYNGRDAALALLLKHNVKVNPKTAQGATPLMMACRQNSLGCISRLVAAGADIMATNNDGQLAYDLCLNDAAREMLEQADQDGRMREVLEAREAEERAREVSASTAGLTLVPGEPLSDYDSPRAADSPAAGGGGGGGAPPKNALAQSSSAKFSGAQSIRLATGANALGSDSPAPSPKAGGAPALPGSSSLRSKSLTGNSLRQSVEKGASSGAGGKSAAAAAGGSGSGGPQAVEAATAGSKSGLDVYLQRGGAAGNKGGRAANLAAAGGGQAARPKSGNKKFLERYGLEKMTLFAPE